MIRRPPFLLPLVACAVLTGALAAAPSGAVTVPKMQSKAIQVDLAGYVEVAQLNDTTGNCSPGEHWIQTNRFVFETGTWATLRVSRIPIPGETPVVTSTANRPQGDATTTGSITDYRATNYCSGTKAKLDGPPACAKNAGKVRVSLVPGSLGDDQLAPLGGQPLLLTIWRAGGGIVPIACATQGATIPPDTFDNTLVTTAIAPGPAVSVAANLDDTRIFALKRSTRIRRTVRISGPCDKTTVDLGGTPGPSRLQKSGDCWYRGRIVVTVRAKR